MSVGRICVRQVDLADADESVWQAAERMRQRAVGTLLIVNERNEPTGIVTDRDLVERVLAVGRDPNATPISDVLTRNPETINEDAPIASALSAMRAGGFRRLPVVDSRGALVGLLSLDDVLMLLTEEFSAIGGVLSRQTPRGVAERSAG